MAKQVMRRAAGDNKYLHRDFHGALSAGIEYLEEKYGEDAVREYLWQFARSFYAPLTEALGRRGLVALEEHFRRVYDLEGGEVRFTRSDDELRIEVDACPAVTHMRKQGYSVARLFHETKGTVGKAICCGTGFEAELLEYDDQTGRSVQKFFRAPARSEATCLEPPSPNPSPPRGGE
jgi:hypothetical protein